MYKNCDDVPILPDQYYPPWVLELAKPQMNNEECYINSTYGITVRLLKYNNFLFLVTICH